jgi:hypothetical protein
MIVNNNTENKQILFEEKEVFLVSLQSEDFGQIQLLTALFSKNLRIQEINSKFVIRDIYNLVDNKTYNPKYLEFF